MIAGYVCGRRGALSTGGDERPDWGTDRLSAPAGLPGCIIR
jgi:hypothetical protein